jgi:hypothetical protein
MEAIVATAETVVEHDRDAEDPRRRRKRTAA